MRPISSKATAPKILDENIRQALLDAADGGTAIRNLYNLWKKVDTKFSMAYFCDKAGIPSKGYLSDVMRGKRILSTKYSDGIAQAFCLSGETRRYIKLLIAAAHDKNEAQRTKTEAKLSTARKAIKITRRPMSARIGGIFFAIDVFCAFGLFENNPTRQQLQSYFGDEKTKEVDEALDLLVSMDLIGSSETDCFHLLTDHFVLSGAESDLSHVDFLRQALANAAENIEHWFPQKSKSYFVSSVISVKRDHYEKVMSGLKEQILLVQTDLESNNADMLVRFNMQVYPVTSN